MGQINIFTSRASVILSGGGGRRGWGLASQHASQVTWLGVCPTPLVGRPWGPNHLGCRTPSPLMQTLPDAEPPGHGDGWCFDFLVVEPSGGGWSLFGIRNYNGNTAILATKNHEVKCFTPLYCMWRATYDRSKLPSSSGSWSLAWWYCDISSAKSPLLFSRSVYEPLSTTFPFFSTIIWSTRGR